METDRKVTGLGRSAFLRDALRRAREQKRKERRIQDYVAGYRRVPEDSEMAEAGVKAAAEIFEKEDWK